MEDYFQNLLKNQKMISTYNSKYSKRSYSDSSYKDGKINKNDLTNILTKMIPKRNRNLFQPDLSNLKIYTSNSTPIKKNKNIFLDKEVLYSKLNKFRYNRKNNLKKSGSRGGKKLIISSNQSIDHTFKSIKQVKGNTILLKDNDLTVFSNSAFTNLWNSSRPKSNNPKSINKKIQTLISKIQLKEIKLQPIHQVKKRNLNHKEMNQKSFSKKIDNDYKNYEFFKTANNLKGTKTLQRPNTPIIKLIPPLWCKHGCEFKSKSEETRFLRLYKSIHKLKQDIKNNPEEKEQIILSFISSVIPDKNLNRIDLYNILDLGNKIIKNAKPDQIFNNKIIKSCKVNRFYTK